MTTFARWRARRAAILAARETAAARTKGPAIGTGRRVDDSDDPAILRTHLAAARSRAVDAEMALVDMQRRLKVAFDAGVMWQAERDAALVTADRLRKQARDLGAEVAALRALLAKATRPDQRADRRCGTCLEPMPWGTAHYCTRTAEFGEDPAAA